MSTKLPTPFPQHRDSSQGFTLIEILIAGVLGFVVLSAVLDLMNSQKKTYEVHAQVSEMEQYVRVGMEQMIREIRMAGFGRPSWSVWNDVTGAYDIAYSVQVTQGAGTNPDAIDIIGGFDVLSGGLSSAAAVGATTLTLNVGEGGTFNTTTKSDIYVNGVGSARITAVNADVLTIDTDPGTGGAQGFASAAVAGTGIYIVKHHTYAVSGSILTRNEHLGGGALEMALNVADLQATFVTPVVTLRMDAMTERSDPTYTNPDTGDGHRTRFQTSTVRVRNL